MFRKYASHLKNNGIVPYIWAILCILPFYFIAQSPSSIRIKAAGMVLIVLFLVLNRVAYVSRGWIFYAWTVLLISISTVITILFGYMYLAFFLAFLVGNIIKKKPFYVFYVILLASILFSFYMGILQQEAFFLQQLPFILITWMSVILLPFNVRNGKVMGKLEEKLDDANKKISELLILEERERIARDLHDTLGQKLSLIGLKSDLARRLIDKNPEEARSEMMDVQQTARTALNEVRQMVSSMRASRLEDELVLVRQLLEAAQIDFEMEGLENREDSSLLIESILSMCLKEAITNVVKHSGASKCKVSLEQNWKGINMAIHDNGMFTGDAIDFNKGHGLRGMKERLEFVNGSLDISNDAGTKVTITIPNDGKQLAGKEALI